MVETATAPHAIDAFLRRGGLRAEGSPLSSWRFGAVLLLCSGGYGAVMASYDGFAGDRWLMVLYGALKVPLLFGATLALAVPAFYTLNLLTGLGSDFPQVRRALLDYQLSVSLQLASLAPVTVVMNLTVASYSLLQVWSAVVFGIAAWHARQSLVKRYRKLEAARPVHRRLRHLWFVLYAFVGVQMGWTLRPFLGSADLPAQFFRDDIGNAYVRVAKLVWRGVSDLFG